MRALLGPALVSIVLDAAAGEILMCQGRISGSNRPDITQSSIEFTLEYAKGMQVATFKSNLEPLNGPLVFQLDDAYLRAKQSQPRPLGTESRSIGVTELRVSRSTGQFSLAVALYRDLDVPDGGVLWEGTCSPREAVSRKF